QNRAAEIIPFIIAGVENVVIEFYHVVGGRVFADEAVVGNLIVGVSRDQVIRIVAKNLVKVAGDALIGIAGGNLDAVADDLVVGIIFNFQIVPSAILSLDQ